MKTVKTVIGILVIIGSLFLGWHFLGGNNNTLTDEEIAVEFSLEEQRFSGFESNATLAEDMSASELLAEGSKIILNFSNDNEKQLKRLRAINDELEKISNLDEEEEGAETMSAYLELTKKLELLENADTTKLSKKDKASYDELIAEGQMILMNKMAVTQPKVDQLKEVIENLEKLFE